MTKTTLSLATNRIEPIVPYRIASGKLPYQPPETRIMKKAYHRQSTPKCLPGLPKPKQKVTIPDTEIEPSENKAFTDVAFREMASQGDEARTEVRMLSKKQCPFCLLRDVTVV